MGKFVKNLMEEKEDKYTHTQKPKPRQRTITAGGASNLLLIQE
jgi:hypothetical protein